MILLHAGLVQTCILLGGGGVGSYLRAGSHSLFGLSGLALIRSGCLFVGGSLSHKYGKLPRRPLGVQEYWRHASERRFLDH